MRSSLLPTGLLAASLAAASGAIGAIATPAIPDLAGIEALDFRGHGSLELLIAEPASLEVNSDDPDQIDITRKGRTLRITVDNDADADTRFVLRVPALAAVSLSGATRVTAARLENPKVDIELSGAARLSVEQVATDSLDFHASGASHARLAGSAHQQIIELSGASQYDASALASERVDIDASGASKIRVNVTEQMRIDASGAARIDYSGRPRIDQRVSGAVAIRSLD